MKISEADLRRIIEEELKTIANSKHPSDVEMIEDPNVGGILVDPFEHIPEDVPAVVDKPQARVQHLVPIVRERRYSLRSLLAVGGRDPEGGVEVEINEARFVGGLGFYPNESPKHSEVRDPDHQAHEGSMARSQLRQAAKYSQKLGHMINESDNLPEWVEAKITKASDYLSSVYEYLDYELHRK